MSTFRYLVYDIDAALPFYEALGFVVRERWGPPFVILSRRDQTLWLSGPGTSAARPMPDGAIPAPGGWNRIVIKVSDLNAMVTTLRASGAQFRNEPVSGPGGRQVLIEDPSGNPVELFESSSD